MFAGKVHNQYFSTIIDSKVKVSCEKRVDWAQKAINEKHNVTVTYGLKKKVKLLCLRDKLGLVKCHKKWVFLCF